MRIILDTSVILSYLMGSKASTQVILEVINNPKFELFISPQMLEELLLKVNLPKIKKYFKYDLDEIDTFLTKYQERSQNIIVEKLLEFARDPKDAIFLTLAKLITVDYLISRDFDLLDLKSFESTQIIAPEDFIKKIYN